METIIQRWYDMIRINSVNGHEVDMADYVAEQLRAMGLDLPPVYTIAQAKAAILARKEARPC